MARLMFYTTNFYSDIMLDPQMPFYCLALAAGTDVVVVFYFCAFIHESGLQSR